MQPGSDPALIFDEIQRRWGRDLPRLIPAKSEVEFDSIWNDLQRFKKERGYARLQEELTKLLVIFSMLRNESFKGRNVLFKGREKSFKRRKRIV
jgi:hypothetical protein